MKEVVVIPESKERRYTEPRLTHRGQIFRDLLRRTREAKGLNQTDLAERLKMSQVLISRCEVGDRKVDVLELCAMCEAMEVDVVDFVRDLSRELREHEINPGSPDFAPVERTRRPAHKVR